jgi:hypothetical protein
MSIYKFEMTGEDRKALVEAISIITNQPKKYLGVPSLTYQVGDIIIDKHGTATGEFSTDLLEELAERGFQAEIETVEEAEAEMQDVTEMKTDLDENVGPGMEENAGPETEATEEAVESKVQTHEMDAVARTEAHETPNTMEVEANAPNTQAGRVCIEVPLTGFDPTSLDNLCKIVTSKEPLLKMALGADALPIKVLEDRIVFDWFTATEPANIHAYSQFITQLCITAREKNVSQSSHRLTIRTRVLD